MCHDSLSSWSGRGCPVKKLVCRKDYIWNLAICSCDNGKYLASIIDDSMVINTTNWWNCDEIINTTIKFQQKQFQQILMKRGNLL